MANLYENIISVAEAKNYLRLDSDFNDDDSDIERMIASAFEYIEKQTNHVFRVQDKTYNSNSINSYGGFTECNVDTITIFDTPINTTDFGDKTPLYYSGYVKFLNTDSVTMSIGYSDRANVPGALIQCALDIIKVYYYSSESNENTTLMPQSVEQTINSYRRFIAI